MFYGHKKYQKYKEYSSLKGILDPSLNSNVDFLTNK